MFLTLMNKHIYHYLTHERQRNEVHPGGVRYEPDREAGTECEWVQKDLEWFVNKIQITPPAIAR